MLGATSHLGSHLLPCSLLFSFSPPGTLLASCICPASSELLSSAPPDILTEGASAHLPIPRNHDGILPTSWFRGHKAQQESTVFSPEGEKGPSHTGREMPDVQGSLVIRNMTAQDAGSYTVVLDTRRGRRSVTEQIHVKGEWGPKAGPIRTPPVPAVSCSLTSPLQQNLKIVTISLAHDSSGQFWSHSCVCGQPGSARALTAPGWPLPYAW